jgi:chromosome segregation protein
MAEARKPRLLKDPADWWKVSRYVPEGKQDLVLLTCGGLAAFFLVLAVIGFSDALSEQGESRRLETHIGQRDELQEATEARLNEQKALADQTQAALREAEARAAKLAEDLKAATGRLAAAEEGLERASGTSERLDGVTRAKDEEIDRLNADLARTKKRLAEAMKLKAQAERQLVDSTATAASFRRRSARASGELEENEARIEMLETKLQEREADVLALAEGNEEVERKLAEFPTEPRSAAEAERTYREVLDNVAAHTDRDERIAILFRAKLLLAGTRPFEDKIDRMWREERAAKQADIDREASVVFEEALSKTKAHPETHDRNVKILTDILDEVRGSRYEAMVQREIDRQYEAKAEGR